MRVIAGSARGTRLKVPRGRAVRPTSGRVKEALFSILGGRVCGAQVWDLFAGSGAIGIEALSRGAAECIFVEGNRAHLKLIRENLEHAGLENRAALMGVDVERALHLLTGKKQQADLIFIDAPYQETNVPQSLRTIEQSRLLREGGLLVLELFTRSRLWPEKQEHIDQRRYGDTILAFVEAASLPHALSALDRGH